MKGNSQVTATCPGMVGNVAVGLDVLGHTIDGVSDSVTVSRTRSSGVVIDSVYGEFAEGVPRDASQNTASRAVMAVISQCRPGEGVQLRISKGIPVSAGLGGSAASALAAVVAVNELLELQLDPRALAAFSLAGESIASGATNWDNIYPALMGGLVLTVPSDPPDVISLYPPDEWRCVVRHPNLKLQTSQSRSSLPDQLALTTAIRNGANLAAFLLMCEHGDEAALRRYFVDEIAEPRRSSKIPGFRPVIDAALEAGALGASISGSGPSLFAWCESSRVADAVNETMGEAWQSVGVKSRGWVSGIGSRTVQLQSP